MKKYRNILLVLFFASFVNFSEANADGQPRRMEPTQPRLEKHPDVHDENYKVRQSPLMPNKNIISTSQAKKLAEERFGGKALSASLEKHENENSVYRVKMINGGRVKIVTIPATP